MKRIMIGSKRRSLLGLGVADWRGSSLGIIETNLPRTGGLKSSSIVAPVSHFSFFQSHNNVFDGFGGTSGGVQGGICSPPANGSRTNDGRSLNNCYTLEGIVGVEGALTGVSAGSSVARRDSSLHNDSVIAEQSIASAFAEDVIGKFSPEDAFAALCTSKKYLNMRTVADWSKFSRKLDRRRKWNQWRPTDTLLDYFTSVKYSHSSLLPEAHRKGFTSINVNESGKVRVAKIARSHSIRLDPVDAPKELYKHRLRIDLILDWAYKAGLVPVMMTLTVYHRWHALEPLCKVLQDSWAQLFVNGRQGEQRKEYIDLQGYVRRMEETINDNDAEFNIGNNGWHPHYHVILLIPKNKVATLSKYESELKEIWAKLVCKNFRKVFGEEIPTAYLPALKKHGLVISRYSSGRKKGRIRPVQDSKYLAKIMGYDPAEVYGGDKEMTAYNLKNSKIPFDLLMGTIMANKCDLWCEYAIATKGIPSFKYSKGLEKRVHEYFKANPDKINPDYTKPLRFGFDGAEAPEEKIIANISEKALKFVHKIKRDQEMHDVAKGGYEALEAWITALATQYGVDLGLGVWKPFDINIDDDTEDNLAAEAENPNATGGKTIERDNPSMSMSELLGRYGVPFGESLNIAEDPYLNNDDEGDELRRVSPVEVYEKLSYEEKVHLSMKEDLTLEEAIARGIVKYREEPAPTPVPPPKPAPEPAPASTKPASSPKPKSAKVNNSSSNKPFDEELAIARLSEAQINEMLAAGISLNPAEGGQAKFKAKRKVKQELAKPSTPPPLTTPTITEEEQRKAREAMHAFLKSHSPISSPSTSAQPLEKENTTDQGISAPISQAPEPATPPPEQSHTLEAELAIAAKLDKPGILHSHIQFTPLVSQGLSVNEALEQLSLTPSEKATIVELIKIFRRQVSATAVHKDSDKKFNSFEAQDLTQHNYDLNVLPHQRYSAERAAEPKKTPPESADDDSAREQRLNKHLRMIDEMPIPEEKKAELRCWYTLFNP